MPFRPASSECTGPLWITIRLLWRRQTSAARQTLSLQRYLRYVIMLRQDCSRQVFDVVQLPGTSDDRAVFGSPRSVMSWATAAVVLIAPWVSYCGFSSFFLSYSKYFLWCWLPGRISWSEAQRIAKTSRLNIHWKVSSDSDEHSASTLINIARSSWVVMRPVELTLPPPPPQLSSTSLWTEWRAVLLFCM